MIEDETRRTRAKRDLDNATNLEEIQFDPGTGIEERLTHYTGLITEVVHVVGYNAVDEGVVRIIVEYMVLHWACDVEHERMLEAMDVSRRDQCATMSLSMHTNTENTPCGSTQLVRSAAVVSDITPNTDWWVLPYAERTIQQVHWLMMICCAYV